MFTDSVISFLEFGAVTAHGRVLHRQRVDFWGDIVHFCAISEA